MAPTIMDTGINFNPYILFNNTATTNSISSANNPGLADLHTNNAITLFQVIKLNNQSNTGVWFKWQHSSNPYSGPRIGNEINPGSNLGQPRFDFHSPSLYGTTNINGIHSLLIKEATTNSKSIRLAAAPNANNVTTVSTFLPAGTGKLTLGAEPYGDDYPCNVQIAEVILYKSSLTPAERNKVESYLAVEYGFTLEQTGSNATNYTSSNNAIIWNTSANTGYNNNIVDIGRDDGSNLNQKQSRSVNAVGLVTLYLNNINTFPTTNNANSHTFAANNSFVLIGDNNGSTQLNVCANSGKSVRMGRVWKTQGTGAPFESTINILKSAVSTEVKYLIIADDANFNINVTYISLSDNGTQLYAAATIHDKFFTFGSAPLEVAFNSGIICANGITDITTNVTGGVAPYTYEWQTNPPISTPDYPIPQEEITD